MNYILFDTAREHGNLLPLTFTRPVADLRVGIDTLRAKWEAMLPGEYSYLTESYLAEKFPATLQDDNIFIAGHLLATPALATQIATLSIGEAIADENEIWAYRGASFIPSDTKPIRTIAPCETPDAVRYPHDIFSKNGKELQADFTRITNGRTSAPLSSTCTLIGKADVFK